MIQRCTTLRSNLAFRLLWQSVCRYLVESTATQLLQCVSVTKMTVRPYISLALMVLIAVSWYLFCIRCHSHQIHVVHISPGAWDIADLPKTIEGVIEFAHSMIMDVPLPEWIFQMLDMLNEDDQVQASISVSYLRVRKYHLPLLAALHSLKISPAPSYYYRFHQAVNLPSNWVALGDSIMRINPVFGCGLDLFLNRGR